jgi:hypothetical protein
LPKGKEGIEDELASVEASDQFLPLKARPIDELQAGAREALVLSAWNAS